MERRFGVELEFNTRKARVGRQSLVGACALLDEIKLPAWKRGGHHDGSELEIDSPILKGIDGFKQLKRVMTAFSEAGYACNQSDGTHIHHDAPEFVGNKDLCIAAVDSWSDNIDIINFFVAKNRRNSGACYQWTDQHKEQIKQTSAEGFRRNGNYDRYGLGPRGSLNLWSLREHGTIELRLHEGTLDYNQISAWIRFGQEFLNSVARTKEPLPKFNSCKDLLEGIALTRRPTRVLSARHRSLKGAETARLNKKEKEDKELELAIANNQVVAAPVRVRRNPPPGYWICADRNCRDCQQYR